jgi:2-oxoisovalerate dehydrogenase E2 component (dihydrolipoyl transacylase)
MAAEYRLDLDRIEGTGLGGRVTKKDLLVYLGHQKETSFQEPFPLEKERQAPVEVSPGEEKPEPTSLYETIPLKGMRKAIADHMVLSKRTSPHVTTVLEVDMTRLVDFRNRHKEEFQKEEGLSLTYMPFIVKAVVNALKAYPMLNSSIEEEQILVKHFYNIGVAVALEESLIVPVIHEADKKGIRELARSIHALAARGKAGKLIPADLQGGTFCITNPGTFGAIISTPIIQQPQAAILGVEAIRKMPVVLDDEITIRSMMFLCLSYDHRIVDGATAIRFLQQVCKALENPLVFIL